jgi:hypothetical protein
MTHALVTGGTGMLKDVTLYLLKKYDKVSVIARTGEGFKRLEAEAGDYSWRLEKIQVDYSNYSGLTNSLIRSIQDFGEISLVVSWVHSNAPLAPVLIAKVINDTSTKPDFYEVLGSDYADPAAKNKNREEEFKVFENINYHKIILGFIIEGGSSRWLTNAEISRGIIEAIENNTLSGTIGVTLPWDAKP